MADQRDGGIVWTDETWNPIRGCSRVSAGCAGCYAEGMAARFAGPGQPFEGLAKRVGGEGRWTGDIKFVEEKLADPLRWRRPRKVFVNSVSDLFHENVTDDMRDRIFAVMALAPQHTFQVLTKRPERMREYLAAPETEKRLAELVQLFAANTGPNMDTPRHHPPLRMGPWTGDTVLDMPTPVGFETWPIPNVWLGVSVENQQAADERIPYLLSTPAAVRFLSCEPLVGPVNLNRIHEAYADEGGCRTDLWESCLNGKRFDVWSDGDTDGHPKVDWVIVGGESGPKARPMHPDWVRSLRDQCAAAGVPFLFKQWGEWAGVPFSEASHVLRAGDPASFQPWPHGDGGDLGENKERWRGLLRVGKREAGRLLDGVEHNGFPEVRHG